MTISEYIRERGLTVKLIAQKTGVTRQAIEQYGKDFDPSLKTLIKIATAMTELGAPTTVKDIVGAYQK